MTSGRLSSCVFWSFSGCLQPISWRRSQRKPVAPVSFAIICAGMLAVSPFTSVLSRFPTSFLVVFVFCFFCPLFAAFSALCLSNLFLNSCKPLHAITSCLVSFSVCPSILLMCLTQFKISSSASLPFSFSPAESFSFSGSMSVGIWTSGLASSISSVSVVVVFSVAVTSDVSVVLVVCSVVLSSGVSFSCVLSSFAVLVVFFVVVSIDVSDLLMTFTSLVTVLTGVVFSLGLLAASSALVSVYSLSSLDVSLISLSSCVLLS